MAKRLFDATDLPGTQGTPMRIRFRLNLCCLCGLPTLHLGETYDPDSIGRGRQRHRW
jgi:hypothetical protein